MNKNSKTLSIVFGVVFAMLVLSFASVPLYRKICQVTGWGGTTQKAVDVPKEISKRVITVQFTANTDPALPWRFKPDLHKVQVHVGQEALISYVAQNLSQKPVTGTAVYNVTPLQAGKYFNKVECFCFKEQRLNAGQSVHMPVSFFIDPKIMEDRDLAALETITLSYTFYPSLEKAIEKGYSAP